MNKKQKDKMKWLTLFVVVCFVLTLVVSINVLGANTKNFKDKIINIKDKDNKDKQVHIKDITKTDNDLTITLNQTGYTMFELYQIKIESEKILKENTFGKTIIK